MRTPALTASLVALATSAFAALSAPSVHAARAIEIVGEAPERVRELAALAPAGATLRDVATFETEKREPAALLLWVTDAQPIPDEADLDSCPGQAAGVPLTGVYHLGLAIGGALVNEVALPALGPDDGPALSLPVAHTAYYNHEHWGQGPAIAFDGPGADVVGPTRLLRLADYTADGHAWEVRFIGFVAACGHLETLLAGYSEKQRKVILHPIVSGAETRYWHDNLFASPDAKHAVRIDWTWPCGDHGADHFDRETFRFDRVRERWSRTSASSSRCP